MDDYDFQQIDKEMNKRIALIRLQSEEAHEKLNKKVHPKTELVPIGEYDGNDLLPGCHIFDDSYIVYMEVANS